MMNDFPVNVQDQRRHRVGFETRLPAALGEPGEIQGANPVDPPGVLPFKFAQSLSRRSWKSYES